MVPRVDGNRKNSESADQSSSSEYQSSSSGSQPEAAIGWVESCRAETNGIMTSLTDPDPRSPSKKRQSRAGSDSVILSPTSSSKAGAIIGTNLSDMYKSFTAINRCTSCSHWLLRTLFSQSFQSSSRQSNSLFSRI